MSNQPDALFRRRRQRVRFRVRQAAKGRMRLSVFRSSRHIYAQIIDDAAGHTVAAASTLDGSLKPDLKSGADGVAASAVGKLIAEAGKAREVPEAIRKATEQARRSMIRVPLREGRTLHHDIGDSYGAGRVIIRAAKPGTGIIAGGPMRAIFEALGVQDVVAKSVGSSNPHNMIKATFEALSHLTSPRAVAARRGKKVAEILGRGTAETRETA